MNPKIRIDIEASNVVRDELQKLVIAEVQPVIAAHMDEMKKGIREGVDMAIQDIPTRVSEVLTHWIGLEVQKGVRAHKKEMVEIITKAVNDSVAEKMGTL